jgi:hypothetical protein
VLLFAVIVLDFIQQPQQGLQTFRPAPMIVYQGPFDQVMHRALHVLMGLSYLKTKARVLNVPLESMEQVLAQLRHKIALVVFLANTIQIQDQVQLQVADNVSLDKESTVLQDL